MGSVLLCDRIPVHIRELVSVVKSWKALGAAYHHVIDFVVVKHLCEGEQGVLSVGNSVLNDLGADTVLHHDDRAMPIVI